MKNNVWTDIIKNKHIQVIALIFIIGIALMVCFGGGDTAEKEPENEKAAARYSSDEERLENILTEIEGAGRVTVMITYYGTSEKNIAYDTKTNSTSDESGSEISEDKTAIMSDDEPMILNETYPRVKGVIVIADGADNAYVRQAISESVAAVFDVPAHRICIYKREE